MVKRKDVYDFNLRFLGNLIDNPLGDLYDELEILQTRKISCKIFCLIFLFSFQLNCRDEQLKNEANYLDDEFFVLVSE